MSHASIGILGGGIGGLSTAIALQQKGFGVDVYERHDSPAEIGAGIVCWPNACFVLEQLGILDSVASLAGPLRHMNRFSCSGETLGSLDRPELSRLMKYPSYSIIRKDLMRILTQRSLDLGVNIHYQHDVVSLADGHNNKACVTFGNGNSIQPDIIIGADGRINSLARKYVNEDNTLIYQRFINWIGVFESDSAIFTELSVADYWGVGERFGIVPVSKTKAYWAGGAASESIGEVNPDDFTTELNAMFSCWPDPISRVINETPPSRINKIYVHDHDPIDVWHRNNVILLGDAAHSPLPTSGQGACQALEDAWHLANCLQQSRDDTIAAFEQYTELRTAKTAGITMTGRQLASSIFNSDEAFCKARNIASKKTDYKEAVAGMAKGWSSGLPYC